MMHLAVAAFLEGACDERARTTSFEAPLVVAQGSDGLAAIVSRGGTPAVQALDPMGRPTGGARGLAGIHFGDGAVRVDGLLVTRGDGLRAYDPETGALRWHVYLPAATEEERDVLVAFNPVRRELGVVWARQYLISPERPGYLYTVIHFARLGLDGRWIDRDPIDLTPRDPRHGASLGYLPRMDQLRWTGRGYRFVWWQSDDGSGDRGSLRLGDLSPAGRLVGRVIAAERADGFHFADGPTGTAVVWMTYRAGEASLRAVLPGAASRPFTVVRSGGAPFVLWHRGAFVVAWDNAQPAGTTGASALLRLGRLDARRGVVDVRDAPLDLTANQWSHTRGMFSTPCGVVVHTVETAAQRARPWLWFAP